MKTYKEIIEQYKRPLDVAIALGIVTQDSDYRDKCRASSRVCMWKSQNVPVKFQAKLAELDKI